MMARGRLERKSCKDQGYSKAGPEHLRFWDFFSPNTCLPNVWHLRSTGSRRCLAEGSNFCHNCPWPEANIGITIHQRHPMTAHTFIPQRGRWGPALALLQQGMFSAPLSWCCRHPGFCPAPRSCICTRKWILDLPGLECLFFFFFF